jgi:multidrug resistance efflux pump
MPAWAQEEEGGPRRRQIFTRAEVAELIEAYEESLAAQVAMTESFRQQLELANREISQQKHYTETLEKANEEWKRLAGLGAKPQGVRGKLWWAFKTFAVPTLAAVAAIR